MKSTLIASAVATAALGFSALAFADAERQETPQEARRAQRAEQQRYGTTPDYGQPQSGPGPYPHQAREARDAWEARQAAEARAAAREARERRDSRRDWREAQRGHYEYQRHDGRYDGPGYYPNARQFRRGGYIPVTYRQPQYVVRDWRAHHLYAPPVGQQWVQVGTDYALVAVANGLIVNLMLN